MAIRVNIEGTLVGLDEKSYDGFEGGDGRRVDGGVLKLVYLACGAGRPEVLKVKDPGVWSQLQDTGLGTEVRVTCDLVGLRRSGEFRASVVSVSIAVRS